MPAPYLTPACHPQGRWGWRGGNEYLDVLDEYFVDEVDVGLQMTVKGEGKGGVAYHHHQVLQQGVMMSMLQMTMK